MDVEELARQIDISPSVVCRSGGPFGVVASHFVGARVVGIRRHPDGRWDVHVVMAADSSVPLVESDVLAAAGRVGIVEPVDIHIDDIAAAPPALAPGPGGSVRRHGRVSPP